ncbi:flagellar hook-length control protein FliK, partial [Burkholderia multivorans]
MTGIDSVAAALLASRLDSLLTGGVASAAAGGAAAQVGTPGAGVAPSSEAGGALPQPPAASTQTALSDVARVLDAIARTGGDATPAVVGRMPLVPDPAALFAAAADGAAGQSGHAAAASASSAAKAAAAEAAPPSLAGALRAALAQAVGESGLFYESHLAQWFAGQRPLAALLREPQARIAIAQTSADPDAAPDDDALDALLTPRLSLPSARAAVQPGAVASGAAASGGAPSGGARPARSAPEPMSGAQPHPPLARAAADATDPLHELADWRASVARPADAAAPSDAASPTPVHPAAVPIVRQQLDTLATDQFRWTGEAWPGVRVDWTIEPDESGGHAPRSGDDAGDGIAWRTRLTLTLP